MIEENHSEDSELVVRWQRMLNQVTPNINAQLLKGSNKSKAWDKNLTRLHQQLTESESDCH